MPLVQVDLNRKLEPLDWYVDGLILKSYLNLVASLPGHGKTAMLTGLAWQASRPDGGEFLGERVSPGVTIFVDYDAPGDGRSVRFWLDKHRAAYPDGDMNHIIVLEPDAETYGLQEKELKQLDQIVKATGANLVIVDSFMAAFPSTDPVKLTAVQGPLWYLRRLATETSAAVILIDHLPKPMTGEVAGARGVMGSIAKPAQSRTVHLLTRVPAKEVQGRNVLRWDVHKMSFAALPEPFGVELHFDADAVRIEETALPDAYVETKTERAVRAMHSLLELKRGIVVDRKELLDVAIKEGNVRERAAKNALKELLERLGDAVAVVQLPGRGQPVGYRLKGDEEPGTKPTAPKPQIADIPSETTQTLGHTPLHQNPKLPQKTAAQQSAPPEVQGLYQRFIAGNFSDRPDLHTELGQLFGAKQADAQQKARLKELAQEVSREAA